MQFIATLCAALFAGAAVYIDAPGFDKRLAETRQSLERWNRLHVARSTLSVVALVLFLPNG